MSFGGDSVNDEITEQEQRAAAYARQQEMERQRRIQTGLDAINAQFDGGPIYGNEYLTWTVPQNRRGQPMPLPSGGWELPDGYLMDGGGDIRSIADGGNVPDQGTQLKLQRRVQTGVGTGFDNAFYENYRKAYEDYYMPELADQYKKAKKQYTFDFADAGTTRSSMAGDALADLVGQNTLATGKIKAAADSEVGSLRDQVQGQKQALINQLYATENPDIAASSSTNAVRTLRENRPSYSPLGDAFTLAMVGGAGYAGGVGARNQYYNTYGSYPANRSQGSVVR